MLLLLLILAMAVVMVVVAGVCLGFALGQDLLACYPPALTVFFGEQRLVVPFGRFGRVGHVRVAFREGFDCPVDRRLRFAGAAILRVVEA